MRTCKVEGCENAHAAKGYCGTHYTRVKRLGAIDLPVKSPYCKVGGCETKSRARGWCEKHYQRWWKHGDPSIAKKAGNGTDPLLCFEQRVVRNQGGCWGWIGPTDHHGYGSLPGKVRAAHRFSYLTFVGPIPPGLFVLHSCDNPPCTNPDHLRVGTVQENYKDMAERGRGVIPLGSHNGKSTLTEKSVMEIKDQIRRGIPPRSIAYRYDVDPSVISKIKHGKLWRHVE